MRGEDRGDRQPQMRDPRHCNPTHPLVEVSQDRAIRHHIAEQSKEFRDRKSECNHLVHLTITGVDRDPVVGPHHVLVAVQIPEAGAVIDEDHLRPTGDHPPAKVTRHAAVAQSLERLGDRAGRRLRFEFHRCGLRIVRADKAVPITPGGAGLWPPWCGERCRSHQAANTLPKPLQTAAVVVTSSENRLIPAAVPAARDSPLRGRASWDGRVPALWRGSRTPAHPAPAHSNPPTPGTWGILKASPVFRRRGVLSSGRGPSLLSSFVSGGMRNFATPGGMVDRSAEGAVTGTGLQVEL